MLKLTSYKETSEQFVERFGPQRRPGKSVIFDIVKLFRTTGSVTGKKRQRRRTVLNQDKVNEIKQVVKGSPGQSLRRLNAQVHVSYSSCHTAVKKLLKMHPYKITAMH